MVVRNMMWCLALAMVGGCTMPTFYNTEQSERNTARGTELLKAGEFDQAEEQLQAAVQAVRALSDLPIFAQMSFGSDGMLTIRRMDPSRP